MIRSFHDRDTERLAARQRVKKWSPELSKAALRKLRMLDAAEELIDPRVPPATDSNDSRATGKVNTPSASTTSGASASAGKPATPTTSRSWTTTRR
jgi:hypothetical protein